MTNTSRWEWG